MVSHHPRSGEEVLFSCCKMYQSFQCAAIQPSDAWEAGSTTIFPGYATPTRGRPAQTCPIYIENCVFERSARNCVILLLRLHSLLFELFRATLCVEVYPMPRNSKHRLGISRGWTINLGLANTSVPSDETTETTHLR